MTPKQIELHRKRFEERMRFKGFCNAHFEKNRIGGYSDIEIQSRFSGYLMAIENMEIELTGGFYNNNGDDNDFDHKYYHSEDVKSAIQSLGLKVKER